MKRLDLPFKEKAIRLLRLVIVAMILLHYHLGLMDVRRCTAGYVILILGLVYAAGLFIVSIRKLIPIPQSKWTVISADLLLIALIMRVSGDSYTYLFYLFYLPIIGLAIINGIRDALLASLLAGTFLIVSRLPYVTSQTFIEIASFLVVAFFVGLMEEESARDFNPTAARDSLTDLLTKTPFHELLQTELAAGSQEDLALLIIDIDDFSQFNQRHGHAKGNLALQKVAEGIVQTLRTKDLVARYGGEEFAVLLPATGVEAATQTAERLREVVAGLVLPGIGESVRVSVGIACAPEDAENVEDLSSLAMKRLYRAKDLGGNRVVASLAE